MSAGDKSVRGLPRILTDLRIPQLPWWADRVTEMPSRSGASIAKQLREAFWLVYLSHTYDVVITSNVRNGLALALYKRLMGRRSPKHIMVETRFDDPLPSLAWKVKLRLQQFAFATVDRMCVSARRELSLYAQRLQLPAKHLQFVPWHTNVLDPAHEPDTDEYVFSAGRTGRDWSTLAAAVAHTNIPVVVVCDREAASRQQFPDNVTVHVDIPYERYRELLRRARVVVLPLERHVYSSGQVVILEAMALGKPLVVSNVVGTEDYIRDGVSGFLVEPENPEALRRVLLRLLTDQHLERAVARNGLEQVMQDHTLQKYAETILSIAQELAVLKA